jgi:Zn finger protein HypA/HybF involved in hydrogenase expression
MELKEYTNEELVAELGSRLESVCPVCEAEEKEVDEGDELEAEEEETEAEDE